MAEKDLTLRFKVTDEGTVVLDKISQKISSLDKTAQVANKSLSGMGGALSLIKWDSIVNLGARAIQAGEQVYEFAKNVASSLNDIKNQAETIGISTDELQKFQYAAKMSDVSNESLTMGMKGLSKSMEEFAAGAGDGYEILTALGLSALDTSGKMKPLPVMFMEIAGTLSKYAGGAREVDFAQKLMGRSGIEMVKMLNKGEEVLKALGDEAVRTGTVISESLVNQGADAETNFKKLNIQLEAGKGKLAPLAEGFSSLFLNMLGGLKDFKEWADANPKIWGFIIGTIIPAPVNIAVGLTIPEEKKGLFFKSVNELLAYAQKKAGEVKPELPQIEPIKYDKGAIKDFVAGYREELTVLKELGVVSTEFQASQIKTAEITMKETTAAFQAQKITILDYANALKSLTQIYNDFTGGDVTKKLVDLEEKTTEAMQAIDKNQPDWKKQMAKVTDAWIEERNKIQEKSPVYIRANLTKWEEDLKEAARKYNEFYASIKPVPIQGTISAASSDKSSAIKQGMGLSYIGETAPPAGNYGGSWDANLQNKLVNIEFTATGASPKMPLGDALKKIADKFGGLDKLISGLEVEISFEKSNYEMKQLQKEMNKYLWVQQSWQGAINDPYSSIDTKMYGYDVHERNKLFALMEDVQDRMDLLKKEQSLSALQEYVGSFQSGTTYVPKTGWAIVHEGERITQKNQTTHMGGVTIQVSGAGDPVKVANEIAKVLKYGRSSQLREAING